MSQERVLQNKDIGPTLVITDHNIPIRSLQFGQQRRFFDRGDVKIADHGTIRKTPAVEYAVHQIAKARANLFGGKEKTHEAHEVQGCTPQHRANGNEQDCCDAPERINHG